MDELSTLGEQAAAVAAGTASPRELVRRALEGLARWQPSINAFTQVVADDAIALAAELERSPRRGPLHGVPIVIKELFDVAGLRTTGCTAPYMDRPAAVADADAVARLRAAGAIVIAKTNQHELACGATNRLSSFGPVVNPWGESRLSGGSSGGSAAAVAAGIVAAAMGSDTGGSIRIPSSFCGVTGLKPTHGAVSLRGAMPLAPSLDTAGPIAASAGDCALVFEALGAGAIASVPARPRLALPERFFRNLHPETRRAVEQAVRDFESLGATIEEAERPDPDDAWEALAGIMWPEFAHHYRDLWEDDRVHPEVAALLAFGRSVTAADRLAHLDRARDIRADFDRALGGVDALLCPCTPYPAPPLDADEVAVEEGTRDVPMGGPARLTLPVNVAGLPALALPVGFSSEGMPIGAQLIGRAGAEPLLLALGARYQEATGWHRNRPG